jgi:hypothetical protein
VGEMRAVLSRHSHLHRIAPLRRKRAGYWVVLVGVRERSKTFQRFAIRTEKSLQEMNKKGVRPRTTRCPACVFPRLKRRRTLATATVVVRLTRSGGVLGTASEAQKVFEAELAQGMKELEKQKKSGSGGRS